MDRRERRGDFTTAMLAVLQGWQSQLWTALPGQVVNYRSNGDFPQTVDVQPTIQARWQLPDGTWEWVTLPLLLDCPVYFPKGGGVSMTFPIKPGDECLVVFSSRCVDTWWQNGGIGVQAELRMHDLSDGFAFVGFSSKPAVVPNISNSAVQIRTDDGTAYIELDATSKRVAIITPGNLLAQIGGTTDITSTGAATWNVPAGLQINGNVSIDGTVIATGEGTFNGGHTVSQHTHTQGNDTNGDTEVPTNPPQG